MSDRREGQIESEPKPALTFDEFTELTEMGKPRYNNFWFFFTRRDLIGSKLYEDPFLDEDEEEEDEKQQKELYRRCHEALAKRNPELEKKLREGIQNCEALSKGTLGEQLAALKNFEEDLHKAYLIMKESGATDDELFS